MSSAHRLVLFDLDGTLIEFHHDYLFTQAEQILIEIGHPKIERTVLEDCFSSFDFFRFFELHRRDELTEQFWSRFDWANFPHAKPFERAHSTLQHLVDQGIEVAIVTSRFVPEPELRQKLAHTGLVDFMSMIKTRPGDHIHWTDKRASIREVCQALDVEPGEAMMVGDIPADIESALDVGIGTAVAVLSGGIKHEILAAARPHHIISDIGELCGLIKR